MARWATSTPARRSSSGTEPPSKPPRSAGKKGGKQPKDRWVMFRRTCSAPLALGRRILNVHRVGELWGLMYELGNRMGKSWRRRFELEKQTKKPSVPKCAHKASGELEPYSACGQPAEYCATEPVSTDSHELRIYWICRQHAELEDAEKEWGDSISDLLEWELVLDEARNMETHGLAPGRRTNQSFGYECRRRESTPCREQHHATRRNSNERPSASSDPRRIGALPR